MGILRNHGRDTKSFVRRRERSFPFALLQQSCPRSSGDRAGVTGGLKARVPLAWGIAPGKPHHMPCGLKARVKRLIPHKLLVVRHTVLHKHRPHLRLEIPSRMMLRLPSMYRTKAARSAKPTENTAYPRCQQKRASSGPLLLIHFDEETFSRSTTRATGSVFAGKKATCTWSAIPPTRTPTCSDRLNTVAR